MNTLEGLLSATCWRLNVGADRVRSRSRLSGAVTARHLFFFVASRARYTGSDVARFLSIDPSTVQHAIANVRDKYTREELSKLCTEIEEKALEEGPVVSHSKITVDIRTVTATILNICGD